MLQSPMRCCHGVAEEHSFRYSFWYPTAPFDSNMMQAGAGKEWAQRDDKLGVVEFP